MLHGIEQMTGKVEIIEMVRQSWSNPRASAGALSGLPAFTGYIFGHPEAITFPVIIRNCRNY